MKKHYILQALTADKKSAYIDDVPNGKKCACLCAECGGSLVAKNKGKIKVHHFAHASGNDNIKCSQTALHLLAKAIIAEEKRVPIFQNDRIEFVQVDFIEQEKNLGDIIPDLYTETNGKPIAVEIFVSHQVDDAKFEKIQNHKLTTFEINLSQMHFETKDEVKNAIYDLNNIRPIYDEFFTEKSIADKKKFIDTNGTTKNIVGEIISQCPMSITVRGRKAELDNVHKSTCEMCPFGYKKEDENFVHCIGHSQQIMNFSMWIFNSLLRGQSVNFDIAYDWQINISKNKVVQPSEIAEWLSLVTKQNFSVTKSKKRKL